LTVFHSAIAVIRVPWNNTPPGKLFAGMIAKEPKQLAELAEKGDREALNSGRVTAVY
jgi:hypothetical protein